MKVPAKVEPPPAPTQPPAAVPDIHPRPSKPTASISQPDVGAASAEAAEPGFLSVSVSKGWARVYLDGMKLPDTTPLRNYAVQAGVHEVRVLNEEAGIDERKKITVQPGGPVEVVVFEGR